MKNPTVNVKIKRSRLGLFAAFGAGAAVGAGGVIIAQKMNSDRIDRMFRTMADAGIDETMEEWDNLDAEEASMESESDDIIDDDEPGPDEDPHPVETPEEPEEDLTGEYAYNSDDNIDISNAMFNVDVKSSSSLIYTPERISLNYAVFGHVFRDLIIHHIQITHNVDKETAHYLESAYDELTKHTLMNEIIAEYQPYVVIKKYPQFSAKLKVEDVDYDGLYPNVMVCPKIYTRLMKLGITSVSVFGVKDINFDDDDEKESDEDVDISDTEPDNSVDMPEDSEDIYEDNIANIEEKEDVETIFVSSERTENESSDVTETKTEITTDDESEVVELKTTTVEEAQHVSQVSVDRINIDNGLDQGSVDISYHLFRLLFEQKFLDYAHGKGCQPEFFQHGLKMLTPDLSSLITEFINAENPYILAWKYPMLSGDQLLPLKVKYVVDGDDKSVWLSPELQQKLLIDFNIDMLHIAPVSEVSVTSSIENESEETESNEETEAAVSIEDDLSQVSDQIVDKIQHMMENISEIEKLLEEKKFAEAKRIHRSELLPIINDEFIQEHRPEIIPIISKIGDEIYDTIASHRKKTKGSQRNRRNRKKEGVE